MVNITEKFKELGLGNRRVSSGKLVDNNGRFNVIRKGAGIRSFSMYHWLINLSWPAFFCFVLISYILINLFFASLYFCVGPDKLTEWNPDKMHGFLYCFYFSTQTLTTVGYGHISPLGEANNLIAAFEAMMGLVGFALSTSIMYGRFSKAKSKILFSENILVAPYRGKTGLKFRIANSRKNELIEMDARVMYSFLHNENGEFKRRYVSLDLEIDNITLFPLPWTIVHPINEASPLYEKDKAMLKKEKAEFLVILKGFDETFNQYVHQIHDYDAEEIRYGVNFEPMYDPAAEEGTVVYLNKISKLQSE